MHLAEVAEDRRIVVAERAGMDLQDEPVFETHRRHFREHLRAEELGVLRRDVAAAHSLIERRRLAPGEIRRARRRMSVIGRSAADRLEIGAPRSQRRQIAVIGRDVSVGDAAELHEVFGEARESGIDHGVGAEGREYAPAPAARRKFAMMPEVVERAFRRRQRLDVEPFEQGARPELGTLQTGGNVVIGPVRIRGAEPFAKSQHFGEGVVDPHPGRRAPEQVEVFGEATPNSAGIVFHRAAVKTDDADLPGPDALTVEHTMHIMIRRDEEMRGVGERGVIGEPLRVGVAVRAEDRKVGDGRVEPPRDVSRVPVCGKQAVGMQREGRRRRGHREASVDRLFSSTGHCDVRCRQFRCLIKCRALLKASLSRQEYEKEPRRRGAPTDRLLNSSVPPHNTEKARRDETIKCQRKFAARKIVSLAGFGFAERVVPFRGSAARKTSDGLRPVASDLPSHAALAASAGNWGFDPHARPPQRADIQRSGHEDEREVSARQTPLPSEASERRAAANAWGHSPGWREFRRRSGPASHKRGPAFIAPELPFSRPPTNFRARRVNEW